MKRNHTGHRMGQDRHRAKLTDVQVAAMRAQYQRGGTGYGRLARQFGCGESTARDIVQYRTRP